ncbi:fungal-specific transcription factor domain-containing protein [Tricladium varicosporioides]|nr:fungal-specific transcription factor domain-containing protein [Hymenoscyphus varicosporioides]
MIQLQKRRKTLLACRQCRTRKTRCNGRRPLCGSCEDRGWQCLYESSAPKPHSSLVDMESRLSRLERNQPHTVVAEPPTSLETLASGQINSTGEYELESISMASTRVEGSQRVSSLYSIENDRSFFSNSSIDSFIRQVNKAVQGDECLEPQSIHNSADNELNGGGYSTQSQASTLLGTWGTTATMLPERQIADELMDSFREHIHSIFPVLHWPTLWRSYQQLWEPRQTEPGYGSTSGFNRAVFYSTLNIIFALGSQYYSKLTPEEKIAQADQFYQRSRTFMSLDTLDNPCLADVQMLLLVGIYLQSTRYANRCWTIIGIALRTAQGLGLYREPNNTSQESQLKREMRRRIWYNCFMLDKLAAATFGKPGLLSRNWCVKIPDPIDDEFLQETGEGCQKPQVSSKMEFFVCSIKLFHILDEILSVFYSQSSDTRAKPAQIGTDIATDELPFSTFALNSKLDAFLTNLPRHLRLENYTKNPQEGLERCFVLQAKTLYCRSLYIRILLLRPWLVAGIQRQAEQKQQFKPLYASKLEENAVADLRRECVSTAQLIIEMLYDQQQSAPPSTSWHAVYFSFSAASVLWAAASCPQSGIDIEIEPYRSSWERAITILRYNRVQLQASLNAIEVLEECRNRLLDSIKRGVPTSDEATQESYMEELGSAVLQPENTVHSQIDWISAMDSSFFDLTSPNYFVDSMFLDEANNPRNQN